MPLLNYTTKIDVYKSLGEIQATLAKNGAKRMVIDYNSEGRPTAISFLVDTPHGIRGIQLPSNAIAVFKVMEKQKLKPSEEQAERVAWRILKDWVEAQMAILESNMVSMEQIFLPYMVNDKGLTVYELYKSNASLPMFERIDSNGPTVDRERSAMDEKTIRN